MMFAKINEDSECTLEMIQTMCKQEQQGYATCGYLNQRQEMVATSRIANELNLMPESRVVDIDANCRTKMATWSYQVVDFCKFNRETVAISMNLLDRYMSTIAAAPAKADRKIYQLAAMTALYTAIKIHEPEAVEPKLISFLTRGAYTPCEVEQMEMELLTALSWRMNPPTALSFIRLFLDLITDTALDEATVETLYELAKFQTELAVTQYDFLSIHPSAVGYCALINSLKLMEADSSTVQSISSILTKAITLSSDQQQDLFQIQIWLYDTIACEPSAQQICANHQPKSNAKTTNLPPARQSSCELSPRSIAL